MDILLKCAAAAVTAAVLGLVVYVTLVHGILLRKVRDRKNKKLRDATGGQTPFTDCSQIEY